MLKTIHSKSEPNILYSGNMSKLIGELADTYNFQREAFVKKQGYEITCFNRRLHEINIEKSKLFLKIEKSLSASSLILASSKIM